MDCNEYNKYLSSFVDGELPSAAQIEMQLHGDTCAPCRENFEVIAELGRQIRASSQSAPVGMRSMVLANALAAKRNPRAPKSPWPPIFYRVAAVVLGMSSVWLMQSALSSPAERTVGVAPTFQSLVIESESSLELGGSFESHFIALRRRPEGRLMSELLGGR